MKRARMERPNVPVLPAHSECCTLLRRSALANLASSGSARILSISESMKYMPGSTVRTMFYRAPHVHRKVKTRGESRGDGKFERGKEAKEAYSSLKCVCGP